MDYKELWISAILFFKHTNKTNWGKNQIVDEMRRREIEMIRGDKSKETKKE